MHRTIPPVSQQTPLARDKRRSCGSSEHSEPGESTSLSNCPLFPTNALGAEGVTVGNEHTRTKTNSTELCSSILVGSVPSRGLLSRPSVPTRKEEVQLRRIREPTCASRESIHQSRAATRGRRDRKETTQLEFD